MISYNLLTIVVFLLFLCIISLERVETCELSTEVTNFEKNGLDALYNCIDLYFLATQVLDGDHDHSQDFPAFQACIGASDIRDEKLKLISESITIAHLEKIHELFEACRHEEKSASDVEAIVKSEYFFIEFKDFVPFTGPFSGSSFIWTTLTSFDQDFDRIGKKLETLLKKYKFNPLLKAGLSDIISPLSFASQRGMKLCVKILLQYEHVNCFDADGYTPLLNACFNGDIEIINMLLRAGGDPLYSLKFKPDPTESQSRPNNDDSVENEEMFATPPLPCDFPRIKEIIAAKDQLSILHGFKFKKQVKMAYIFGFDAALKILMPDLTDFKWPESLFLEIIGRKCTKLIQSLLESGKISWTLQAHNLVIMLGLEELYPKLNEEYFSRRNIELAAHYGHIAIVALHLDRNLPIYTSLLLAASANHVKIVELLLSRCGTNISERDAGEALKSAIIFNNHDHTECVALLLEKRPDIPFCYVWEVLESAVQKGRIKRVKVLLEKRRDISKYYAGWALIPAAGNGDIECVTLLLAKGIAYLGDSADIALKLAAENGHSDCLALIIKNRFFCIYTIIESLELAAENGHAECVKLILEERKYFPGYKIARDALCLAARNGRNDCIKVLLETKIIYLHLSCVNKALQEASVNGHTDCVALLLEKQIEISSRTMLENVIGWFGY